MVNWKQNKWKSLDCHVSRAPVPERLAVCLEILFRVLKKTAVQRTSAFFVIIRSSLFLKEQILFKATQFYEKCIKIVWKPMKHNKNADTLLFLLSFTKWQREKKYWKNILCECRRSKRGRNSGFWHYFTTVSTESKKLNFQ